jgi:2'-5' RNA ligase
MEGEPPRRPEPTARLFFALWPDEAVREALVRETRKAVRASGGRPVPPENLHATLVFLGSVPIHKIDALRAIAARISSEAFALEVDRLEHWAKPQVLCASATNTPAPAADLARTLRDDLLDAGFAPDVKPFRAHVTLARKVGRVARLLSMRPVAWRCADFALVESRTEPSGSLYSRIASWPLYDAQSP